MNPQTRCRFTHDPLPITLHHRFGFDVLLGFKKRYADLWSRQLVGRNIIGIGIAVKRLVKPLG